MHDNYVTITIEDEHVATVLECLQLGLEAYVANGLPDDAARASRYISEIQHERTYQAERRQGGGNCYTKDF